MPSNSETGHAKNADNFEKIISFIMGYGTNFNPSKTSIKTPALNAQLLQARADIAAVGTKTVAFNNTVNARAIIFAPVQPLATRIINAFIATDASDEAIKDARTIVRKIQGKRAKPKDTPTDPNAPAPNNISASQQSYDQQVEHFSALLEIVKAEPSYAPNENDLKVATLTTQLAGLKTANTNVNNAYTAVSNARIARDKTLYKPTTGVHDVVADIKSYVKSAFGATSPEFKQISKIAIKKIEQ